MPYIYESATGGKLAFTRCRDGHLQAVAESASGRQQVALCIPPDDVRKVTGEMHEWAQLADRWAELGKWLRTRQQELAAAADAEDSATGRAILAIRAEELASVAARMSLLDEAAQ